MPLSLTEEERRQYTPLIRQYIQDHQSHLVQQPVCMFYGQMANAYFGSFGRDFVRGFLAATDAGYIPRTKFPQTRMSYFAHAPLTSVVGVTSTPVDSQKDLIRSLETFLINHRNLLIKGIINQIKFAMIKEEHKEKFYIELFFHLRDTHFSWKDIEKLIEKYVGNTGELLEKEDVKKIKRCNDEIKHIHKYGINERHLEAIGPEPLGFIESFKTKQRTYYENNTPVADFVSILLTDGFGRASVEPHEVRLKHLWTQAVYSYLELVLSYVLTEESTGRGSLSVTSTSSSTTSSSSHMATVSATAQQRWIELTKTFINLEQIRNLLDCSRLPVGAKDEHGNDNWLINKSFLGSLWIIPGFCSRLRAYNDGVEPVGDFERLRLDLVTCFAVDTPVVADYLKTTQAQGVTLLSLKAQHPSLSSMLFHVSEAVLPSRTVQDVMIVTESPVKPPEDIVSPHEIQKPSVMGGLTSSSPVDISPRQLALAQVTSTLWDLPSPERSSSSVLFAGPKISPALVPSTPRLSSSLPSSSSMLYGEGMRVYQNPLCTRSVPSFGQSAQTHVGLFSPSPSIISSPPQVPCLPLSLSSPVSQTATSSSSDSPPAIPTLALPSSSPLSQTTAALLSPRARRPEKSDLLERMGFRRRSDPDSSKSTVTPR